MEENKAAMSGTGEKAPEVAAPVNEEKHSETAAPQNDRRSDSARAEDGRYAAARRRAEAERDQAIEQMDRLVKAERGRLAGEQERTRQERMRIVADDQVREISRLDGEIQSIDDLLAMPEYEEFYELVKRGVSMVQAYKLTRYDRLMQRASEAAARQTVRSLGSRQHLAALAGQPGMGEYVSVPAEVAAEYRLAKPGITDAEIRRKYRKYKKYQRQ